jgi:hypothetical protein
MLLPALPAPRLTESLIAHAGYAAAAGTAAMTAVAACAAFILLSRKQIAWDTWLDMPAGLDGQPAAAPGGGPVGHLVLGEPGLRYCGPWAGGIQHGWLVVVGITNPGPATSRSGDFSTPLAFAFPGREVHAARLLPESAGRPARTGPGMPAVRVPGQDGPAAARVELTGDFLLRPGDSYSLLLVLSGTPADQSRRVRHEGSLARGRIIAPAAPEPAI